MSRISQDAVAKAPIAAQAMDHPEKPLLAYVMTEAAKSTARVAPEESDKYVLLTIWNLVNCIVFVALPGQKAKRSGAPKRRKP